MPFMTKDISSKLSWQLALTPMTIVCTFLTPPSINLYPRLRHCVQDGNPPAPFHSPGAHSSLTPLSSALHPSSTLLQSAAPPQQALAPIMTSLPFPNLFPSSAGSHVHPSLACLRPSWLAPSREQARGLNRVVLGQGTAMADKGLMRQNTP